ncbi:MAG TPA: UvrD-helicase domain-containing protein, partial [Thermodesulfovibrionales bacterium]|nr:UvrD-helicase domain-containing protein [Thermodesulfovibrionales bacterium]
MSVQILDKDIEIPFPHFLILKASAGSGKTYALTERFVQFILSEKLHHSSLRNIVAVTFSNNAAKEMKERVLTWLKSACLEEPKAMTALSGIISLDPERTKERACGLVEEILDNYSDFQVKTIDSFMTTVFKASAIDFGYNPEFDILMDTGALMDYSFNLFLRTVREGTPEAGLFEEIICGILEQKRQDASFPWDPSKLLLDEMRKIYGKLSSAGRKAKIEDCSEEIERVKEKIRSEVEELQHMVSESGLALNRNSAYPSVLDAVSQNRFSDLPGKPLKNPPVNKPDKKQPAMRTLYDMTADKWSVVVSLISVYTSFHARSYYTPYLRMYDIFREKIETMKRQQGKVFIADINRYLAEYLVS